MPSSMASFLRPLLLLLLCSLAHPMRLTRQTETDERPNGEGEGDRSVGIGGNDPPTVNLNEPIGGPQHEPAGMDEDQKNGDMLYDTAEEQMGTTTISARGGGSNITEKSERQKEAEEGEGEGESKGTTAGGGGGTTTEGEGEGETRTTPKGTNNEKKREGKEGAKGKEKEKNAKTGGSRGTGASGQGQTTAQRNCNSEQMRKLIMENIHPKPSIAKRQIQAKVAAQINGKVDVICAKHAFSYIVNSELFCEAESNGVICLCFKQQG